MTLTNDKVNYFQLCDVDLVSPTSILICDKEFDLQLEKECDNCKLMKVTLECELRRGNYPYEIKDNNEIIKSGTVKIQ